MALGPGFKLGPYEVLAPLGAGGMGAVYRARDTRLDRMVALKVVQEHLAASPEARQRFEREARAASSLNHPHICALFDVGHQDGIDYIVMELLDGETLADRLDRGPLPTEQVLRYGIEMADALEKAHRQGIVHRDLKPGNVMLTKSGATLLDFGLAKRQAIPAASAASVLSAMATAKRPLTEKGTILGTFQYMAPEQLEGKEADGRTDLFALGVILYEMATGRRPFTGKSQASLIAAILSADPPPLASVQPLAPPALERLVKVCLAKDPDDRLQTAHDVMQELKWIAEAGSSASVPAPVAARRRTRERLAWVLVGFLPLAASALTFSVVSQRAPAVRPTRFSVPAPAGASSVDYQMLSPDGRNLAFIATVDGVATIWVRPLDSLEAHPLKGTEGVEADYIWSADSLSIAFAIKGELTRIALSGGPPLTICSSTGMVPGDWNRDGIILMSSSMDGVIYQVSASGGTPAPVTAIQKEAPESHFNPTFLPDGRHFLYLARRTPRDKSSIDLASLDSPERRRLVPAESEAFYSPPGYLLFVRHGTLVAQPFDERSLRVYGDAIPLGDDVSYVPDSDYADFSVSANGTLAFRHRPSARVQLTWLDRAGRVLGTIGEPGTYVAPALSPDGKRVVVQKRESGDSQIWLIDLQRNSFRPVTEPGQRFNPVWAPDGRSIIFATGSFPEPGELRRLALDGAGREEVLLKAGSALRPFDVSSDGQAVAYMLASAKGGVDILALPLSGEKTPASLVDSERLEIQPQFSPNRAWLAYSAFDGARHEAYVQPNPPANGRWQVSVSGGFQPRWSPDGRELFYLAPDGTLMSVEVDSAGADFKAGQAKALFRAPVDTSTIRGWDNTYAVGLDGQRFLFASLPKDGALPPVTVVLNWAANLKR